MTSSRLHERYPGIRQKISSGDDNTQFLGVELLLEEVILSMSSSSSSSSSSQSDLSLSERAYLCEMLSHIACSRQVGTTSLTTRLGALYAMGLLSIFDMSKEECCMASVVPVMTTVMCAVLVRHVEEGCDGGDAAVNQPSKKWPPVPHCRYYAETAPEGVGLISTSFVELIEQVSHEGSCSKCAPRSFSWLYLLARLVSSGS